MRRIVKRIINLFMAGTVFTFVPTPKVLDFEDFVVLTEFDPRILVQSPMATKHNFTGEQQYPFPLPLLRRYSAEMVKKAQDIFWADGYRIVIFDAYRPLTVQQRMRDALTEEQRQLSLVAIPGPDSPHGRGITIDCGLADRDGHLIDMPSPYLTFDESSYHKYTGGTEEQRANRDYLISVMYSVGFTSFSREWWHYNAPNPDGITAQDFTFLDFIHKREHVALHIKNKPWYPPAEPQ